MKCNKESKRQARPAIGTGRWSSLTSRTGLDRRPLHWPQPNALTMTETRAAYSPTHGRPVAADPLHQLRSTRLLAASVPQPPA